MLNTKGLANRASRLCIDLIQFSDGDGEDLTPSQQKELHKELVELHRWLGHQLYRAKEYA